jgi:hypothetical protein
MTNRLLVEEELARLQDEYNELQDLAADIEAALNSALESKDRIALTAVCQLAKDNFRELIAVRDASRGQVRPAKK